MIGVQAPLFLGVNLKMYFDHQQTLEWCEQVAAAAARHPAIMSATTELVIMPSFPALAPVATILRGTPIGLGAQNLSWQDRGALTGEVSGVDLRQVGCRYVLIGHAERRRIFHEDDDIVAVKVEAATRNGLTPLVCIGEYAPSTPDAAARVCIGQLRARLARLLASDAETPLVVAYEPEHAIGADRPADVTHIVGVCSRVKLWLSEQSQLGGSRLIYGGSAGPGLLTELGHAVDGLFLGRFAHRVDALRDVIDESSPGSRLSSSSSS